MESYLFGAVEKKIRKGNIIVRVTTLKFVWYWRINLPVELFKIDLPNLLLRSGDVLCELEENTFPFGDIKPPCPYLHVASVNPFFWPPSLFPSNSYPETFKGKIVYRAGVKKRDEVGKEEKTGKEIKAVSFLTLLRRKHPSFKWTLYIVLNFILTLIPL